MSYNAKIADYLSEPLYSGIGTGLDPIVRYCSGTAPGNDYFVIGLSCQDICGNNINEQPLSGIGSFCYPCVCYGSASWNDE
jgi:hypothetical protein